MPMQSLEAIGWNTMWQQVFSECTTGTRMLCYSHHGTDTGKLWQNYGCVHKYWRCYNAAGEQIQDQSIITL